MSDPAWTILVRLQIPDWRHLGSIRSRWLHALAPSGLRIPFEECVAWLAIAREEARVAADEEGVPY
jgi:hypothetical protein